MSYSCALISELRDFRTRGEVIGHIVALDPPPVRELIAALKDPNEGIRYGAVRALEGIHAREACAALLDAVSDPVLKTAAFSALETITGAGLGMDEDAWRKSLGRGAPVLDNVEEGQDAIIEKLGMDDDLDISTTRYGWLVTASLPDGRKQKVRIITTSSDRDGEPILVIFSQCGPADPRRYEWALQQNMKIPYGSLAVREIDGKNMFVMVDTQLARTAQVDEVRKSVLEVAKRSDAIEKALTDGGDAF